MNTSFLPLPDRFSIANHLMLIVLFVSGSGNFLYLQAQNPFAEGKKWYQQRSVEADSFRAKPKYINNAISSFQEALDKQVQVEQSAEYLLRSYYFKGMYLGLTKDQQKAVYDQGKELGERMMDEFPRSAAIKFWYAANSGRWADVYGFWAAARDGLAGKLRDICQEIIEIDPEYQGGGGYRILAQVHFHSPKIPLVMGWPSNEKALDLVQKAVELAPDHPTNLLLYAQILLKFDQDKKARTQLQAILDLGPRPDYLVEDRYVQYRARQLLAEHYDGA